MQPIEKRCSWPAAPVAGWCRAAVGVAAVLSGVWAAGAFGLGRSAPAAPLESSSGTTSAALPDGAQPPILAGNFDDFDDRAGYPTAEELRKVLVPVGDAPLQVGEARKHDRPIRRITGLARLAIPWPAEHALRLGLCDANPFQIYLWDGQRGVMLRYYPEFHQVWAAYAIGRQDTTTVRPTDYVLWATSGDLYRRSGLGTVELHHRQGRLYLVRGEVVLLEVPCPSVPAEVYFEGTALFRGLAVVPAKRIGPPVGRGAPGPFRPSAKSPSVASRSWARTPAEGAHLDLLPGGGVELGVEGKAPLVQAGVSLGGPALWDLVFEVESPAPGTGIYLGDAEGRHLARIGFFRHRETGKVVFDLVPPWSNEVEKSLDFSRQPVPFFGSRRWLRVACGAGVVRLWTSPDGKAWSPVAPSSLGVEGPCSSVGLYCLPGEGKRWIRLHALETGRLGALEAWADPAAQAIAPALRKAESLVAWRGRVAEHRPADIPWERWWRACAVAVLADNCRANVAQAVLDRLVVAELRSPGPLPERIGLLQQAAMLLSSEQWGAVEQVEQWADALAGTLIRRGHPQAFTEVSHALLGLPYWHARRVSVFSEAWLRHELFAAMSAGRWQEVRALVQRVRYYGGGVLREGEPLWGPPVEYLLAWAEAAAAQQLGRAESSRSATEAGRPQRWLHPFVEPSQREAFNILAEFQSALDSQAWGEACQLLANLSRPDTLGLCADRADPQWFLRFPLGVELAVRSQPALRQMIREKFTEVGRLRWKQAAASGDVRGVQAVAHQFPGTEAAADARRWLGDRELSAGRAIEALAQYRRALPDAPPAERPSLLARMRLAAALMGLDFGQPAEQSVQLGGTSLSPVQFETLVQELRKAHAPAASPPPTATLAPGFPPGQYEARALATLDRAGTPRPVWIGQRLVDWFGHQLSVTLTPESMLAGTRASIALLRRTDRQWVWSQQVEVREDRHQAVLVPMHPLVVGNRIFVRRLSNDGAELACLDLAEGKLLWNVRPDSYAASDPVFSGSQLLVLSAAHQDAEKVSLGLASIRAASGRVRHRHHLADFRDTAGPRLEFQLATADDLLVAVGGGVVLCCDTAGRVRWVRRQIWTPPPMKEYSVARAWFDHLPEPPLIHQGVVYATQPGVWGLEAMELDTGRLRWRAPLGNLVRMVGCAGGRVIVHTADGLVALDAKTGSPAWDRPCGPCSDIRLCGPEGPVVILLPPQRGTRPPGLPMLEWFDLVTGRSLGRSQLPLPGVPPGRVEVWLRPLVVAPEGQWVLLGFPRTPMRREILELVRVVDLPPTAEEDFLRP